MYSLRTYPTAPIQQPHLSNRTIYGVVSGTPPTPDQLPYVRVTTETTVRVPAPIIFFNAKMGNGETMTFYRDCTFPIVRTKLYL